MDTGYVSTEPQAAPKIVSAAINLQRTFGDLLKDLRKRHKGNFIREAAAARFATVELFTPSHWAEDIEKINKSLDVRSGGPMRPAYHRSAAELADAYAQEPLTGCEYHWSKWFGVFKPEFVTEPELLGYIQVKRYGTLGMYSTFLGHGAWMQRGIMPRLHMEIMSRLMDGCPPGYKGMKWLMYAGWYDGGNGLTLWKDKAGFNPVMLFHTN